MRLLILSAFLFASVAFGREVIDLGSLKIEGAARGPEIQYIGAIRPEDKTIGDMLLNQLVSLEKQLTAPKPPKTATVGESK